MKSVKYICFFVCLSLAIIIFAQFPVRCNAGEATGNISDLYRVKQIALQNGTASGLKIMRTNDQPLAFIIKCPEGFALCGSFDIKAMEKRKVTAVMFKNFDPKTFKAALAAPVAELTTPARALGITRGMPVRDALEKMMLDH